jgi:DNA-directed RNA polymerase specialized sigma24 family protein
MSRRGGAHDHRAARAAGRPGLRRVPGLAAPGTSGPGAYDGAASPPWRELTTDQLPDRPAVGQDPDDRVLLHRALGTLAPRQRAVIVLRYFEDLTEAQTAEALGIAVGTVKSQARDALRRLREVVPGLADVLVSP